jgi:hypothetical protein
MAQFPTQRGAATAGLVAAPLVPTIAPAFYASSSSPDVVSAFYGATLIYVISLLFGSLLWLPFFYLLGQIRLVNVWACLLGGFLVGIVFWRVADRTSGGRIGCGADLRMPGRRCCGSVLDLLATRP